MVFQLSPSLVHGILQHGIVAGRSISGQSIKLADTVQSPVAPMVGGKRRTNSLSPTLVPSHCSVSRGPAPWSAVRGENIDSSFVSCWAGEVELKKRKFLPPSRQVIAVVVFEVIAVVVFVFIVVFVFRVVLYANNHVKLSLSSSSSSGLSLSLQPRQDVSQVVRNSSSRSCLQDILSLSP